MCQKLMKMSKKLSLFRTIDVPFFIACDMKFANIICGIQFRSSKHPLCWSDVKFETSDPLERNTKNSLRKGMERCP